MENLALWVVFDVAPSRLEEFLAAAREDAQGAMTREPGCRRFDILRDAQQPSRVSFYEVYDDEAAFAAHLQTAHYKRFAEASPPMVTAKTVTRLIAHVGVAR